MEHLTTATEQPTTTMEQPNTTTGQPIAAMEQPTTMEQSATTTGQPAAIMESPTVAMKSSTEAMEQLPTVDQPTTTMEQPTSTTEQPAKTMESPTAAMKQPTTTMEQLTSSLPGAFPSLSIPLTTSLAILANIIRTLTHDATILDTQLARHAPATEASDLPPLAYYYFHNTVSNYLIGADPTLAFVPEEFKAEMQMVLWVVVWWYAMVHCGEGVREKVSNAVAEECIVIIEGDEGEEMVVVKKVVGVWKAWMDRFVEELVAVGEVAKEEKEKKKTSNEVFEWGVLGLMVLPSLLWGGLVRGY